MIIYKREITLEDLNNLDNDEELIYYKSEDIAVAVTQSNNRYIVRKKQISDNKLIEEVFLRTVGEVMDYIERLFAFDD